MSIVKLYTYVLTKLQVSLVLASAKSLKKSEAKFDKATGVMRKAIKESGKLDNEGTLAALESTQLADRAAKLKALL